MFICFSFNNIDLIVLSTIAVLCFMGIQVTLLRVARVMYVIKSMQFTVVLGTFVSQPSVYIIIVIDSIELYLTLFNCYCVSIFVHK